MMDAFARTAPDLRSALEMLKRHGDTPIVVEDPLDPNLEIARHYLENFGTSPAHPRSGVEPMVLYTNPTGARMPVLMGVYGARGRCDRLLGAEPGGIARRIADELENRMPVETLAHPGPSQTCTLPGKLDDLPVLTVTDRDAGPYLTSGLVIARDPESGVVNASIHRMRVIDGERLTIWMLPGRDLDVLFRKARARGEDLPISINIGVAPAIYLTSSITKPFLGTDESELELAGAVAGASIRVCACDTQDAWCLADAEIVVEGAITAATHDEYDDPGAPFGMPEFLGYMGMGKAELPLVSVTKVTTRAAAVYQTFLGPGKEQSELLGIPTEAGMLVQLARRLSDTARVIDAHYLPAAGGQLLLALRIDKQVEDAAFPRRVLETAMECHALLKGVLLVDADIDVASESDLFWAMATRFQPSRDLTVLSGQRGFPLDPSQAPGYLPNTDAPTTDKYLMDLTVPVSERARFRRVSDLV
ncbi:UbiD family decarboxylase [Stappia sp.]|uniref:UbiD family decarboxylase n=1 Tax=Stappia sp. TaxID=1870903 RepID=UPI0032D94F4D